MSQWTHVRGGLELVASPYECKPLKVSRPKISRREDENGEWDKYFEEVNKKTYLPFPEEQVQVSIPRLITRVDGKSYNCIDVAVFSLPRAKKYIEDAFSLLPQGEVGIRPSLKQDRHDYCSSSFGSDVPCVTKAVKSAVEKMYNETQKWCSFSFKELEKYFKVEIGCIDDIASIVVGIREDVRYCSAQEFMEGLEKCLKYLEDHDISIEDGYIEWQDEYDPDHIYAWRRSRLDFSISHQFLTLDRKTNKVVHSKTWAVKRDENGKRMHDENWNTIWEVVEKDGPYIEEEED